MFILFGTKTRFKTLSSGQFYCPQCRTRRTYELRLARDYFTLYFIPIFPVHSRGQVVTCTTCGTNFTKEALATPEPVNNPLERMAREARADLDRGTPIEFARQKLINIGLARELVDRTIEQAAGSDRRVCPDDALTYRSTVERCARCGAILNAVTRPV
jgi:uncharacterized Zn finger protein (UPF0148 family)